MSFEQHCIIALMGHARIAGKVTEQEIGGNVFLRVDVPKTDSIEAFTKFYSASAIYSITPVDEVTCLRAVAAFRERPIETWRLPETPMLQKRVTDADWGYDESYHEHEDEDSIIDNPPVDTQITSMMIQKTDDDVPIFWVCLTSTETKVHVHLGEFHLFASAGYRSDMEAMEKDDIDSWSPPIPVQMEKQNGEWVVVHVYPRPVGSKKSSESPL